MKKTALITGITGQDGSYLAEFLLEKDYEVHGIVRRSSTGVNTSNIETIKDKVHLHYGDLSDAANLEAIVMKVKPDEVYNLAAQSHVHVSYQCPVYTSDIDAIGVLKLLEATKKLCAEKHVKFYQASTSELYGSVRETPQTENTPFYPRSPYAVAKLYGYWITVNYRESYDMFTCNGILFNHESPRRGAEFVTRKIVQGMIKTHLGMQDILQLGNINAYRDWGHAKDYVRAMWAMLQHDTPDDYVLSSGEQHSVRDFCNDVAKYLGFEIEWQGTAEDEIGINKTTGKKIIEVNKDFYRPAEVHTLLGDCSKARAVLNWVPEYTFKDLVFEMCDVEMKNLIGDKK